MNGEIKNKLSSKFKIFTNLSDNFHSRQNCGFTFGDNKHSLVIDSCYENSLIMRHYWGKTSDDLFNHRVHFEDVYYYPSDGSINFNHRGSFRTTPPYWLREYSFQNENLKIDWDEFFKKLDLFMIQYI